MSALKVSENAWTDQVVQACQLFGWHVVHFRAARTEKGWRTALQGDVGFPDILAVRDGWQLALELKDDTGKPTSDQLEWLRAFAAVPTCIATVLRPMDWRWLEGALKRPDLAADEEIPGQYLLTRS